MDIKFSERLAELIDERGFSVKELAFLTEISEQSIYSWKRGNSYKIYLSNLIKICDTLKCSIDFILGLSETVLDFNPKPCPPFYTRLRQVMEEKGISRYKIAKETKIYDNYFTVWKKGREPQIDTLVKLADYLGCSIDYLIGRDS